VTHDRAQPLLLDLAYDELSPDEAREVERHTAECATCAAELESLLATRRLAARLADEPVPARGRAELLAAARRAVAPAPARRRVRARLYAIAASAAVVALVTGVTLRLGGQRSPLRAPDDVPELRDLSPMEDVGPAPSAAPAPAAPTAAPAPAPKRLGGPTPGARPSRAPAPAPLPSAPRHDVAAEREVAAPAPSAAESLAAAPAARAPAGAPAAADRVGREPDGQPPAAGPERSETSRAPQAMRRAARPEASPPSVEPQAIVDDIERRAAAGQLHQEERRLTCDGAPIERLALLDGARVVKLTVRTDDGTVHEGWYDGAGRLRAMRRGAGGSGARLSFPEGEGTAEAELSPGTLPSRAPVPAALPRCAW